MKAILKFNLPEEQEEFNTAVKANDWKNVCWEMSQWLRANTKYASDEMPDEEYKAYIRCRNEFKEIISNNDLTL